MRVAYRVEARPHQEFHYEAAMSKLVNIMAKFPRSSQTELLIPGNEEIQDPSTSHDTDGFTQRRGLLLRLSALIDVECKTTIGCAGAVLTHIGKRKAMNSIADAAGNSLMFLISRMEQFSLRGTMWVFDDRSQS